MNVVSFTLEVKRFVKDWTLPIAIVVGIVSYLIFHYAGFSSEVHYVARKSVAIAQPVLIFLMLFLTFCHVAVSDLRLNIWHVWLLLIQVGASSLFALIAMYTDGVVCVVAETAFCCLVCPTATASSIITAKLGGSIPKCSTYVILSNLMASVVIPLFVPLLHPANSESFISMFFALACRFFPLLMGPLFCAWIVRYFMPNLHKWLLDQHDWAFYLWLLALPMAVAVSTQAMVHSNVSYVILLSMVVCSIVCCVLQFLIGRRVGFKYGDTATAGQALGQKNTTFIIWVAFTYLAPVYAVVGGLYAIWHNNINAYQLYRQKNSK